VIPPDTLQMTVRSRPRYEDAVAHGKLISAAELDLPTGIPPAVFKVVELGQWNRARYLAGEVTALQAKNSWAGQSWLQLHILKVATAHPPSKCRYHPPRLLYTANCGRGLVGREGKPLLDFNGK
jgi:hypothetical protein